jgi:hypothetical protein
MLPAYLTRIGADGRHIDDVWLAMTWARIAGRRFSCMGEDEAERIRARVRAVCGGEVAPDVAADHQVLELYRSARPCACHPDELQPVDGVVVQRPLVREPTLGEQLVAARREIVELRRALSWHESDGRSL